MALFQRKEPVTAVNKLFSMGLSQTMVMVGLGNPGKKYDNTRHNVGASCLEEFVSSRTEFSPWIDKKDLKSSIAVGTIDGKRIIALKPLIYMNESGEAVQAVLNFYKLSSKEVTVIYDDIDVQFGQIRTRFSGSSAGHNGIKSVIKYISKDFGRVRVGIGPKKPAAIDSADFVLAKFSKPETTKLADIRREVTVLVTELVYGGGQLVEETRSVLI